MPKKKAPSQKYSQQPTVPLLEEIELFLELSKNSPDLETILGAVDESLGSGGLLQKNMVILYLQALGIYQLFQRENFLLLTTSSILSTAKDQFKSINRRLIPLLTKDSINKNFRDNFERFLVGLVQHNDLFVLEHLQNMTRFFGEVSESHIKELRTCCVEVLTMVLKALVKHRLQSEQKKEVRQMSTFLVTYILNDCLLPRLSDIHYDIQKMVLLAFKMVLAVDNFKVFAKQEHIFQMVFQKILEPNNTLLATYLSVIQCLQTSYGQSSPFKELLQENLNNLRYYSYSDEPKVMEMAVGILIAQAKKEYEESLHDNLIELLINQNKVVVAMVVGYFYEITLQHESSLQSALLKSISALSQAIHALQPYLDLLDNQHLLDHVFEALDKHLSLSESPKEVFSLLFQEEREKSSYLLALLIHLYRRVPKNKKALYRSLLLKHSQALFNRFKMQLNYDKDTHVVQILALLQCLEVSDEGEVQKYLDILETCQQIFFYSYNTRVVSHVTGIYTRFMSMGGEVKHQIIKQVEHIMTSSFYLVHTAPLDQLHSHLQKLVLVLAKFGMHCEKYLTIQVLSKWHKVVTELGSPAPLLLEMLQLVHSSKLKMILGMEVEDPLFIEGYVKMRKLYLNIIQEYLRGQHTQGINDHSTHFIVTAYLHFNHLVQLVGDSRLEKVGFLYFRLDDSLIDTLVGSILKIVKAMPHQQIREEGGSSKELESILDSFLDSSRHHPAYLYSRFGVKLFCTLLSQDYLSHPPVRKVILKGLKSIVLAELLVKEQEKISVLRLTGQVLLKEKVGKESALALCRMVVGLYTLPKKQVEQSRQALTLFLADIIVQALKDKRNVFPFLKVFMHRGIFETEVLRKFLAFVQTETRKYKDTNTQAAARRFQEHLEKECHLKIDEYMVEEEEVMEEKPEIHQEESEESQMDIGKIVIK